VDDEMADELWATVINRLSCMLEVVIGMMTMIGDDDDDDDEMMMMMIMMMMMMIMMMMR